MSRAAVAGVLAALASACGASTEVEVVAGDAGSDAAGIADSVDVVGAWHACDTAVEFRPDGSWSARSVREGCTTTGIWVLEGRLLDQLATGSDCGETPSDVHDMQVSRTPETLVFVHPSLPGGVSRLYADSLPRSRWRATGVGEEPPANGTTIVRVVGTPGGTGTGCHWSEDEQCGGIVACSGGVEQWDVGNGKLVGRLGCGSECPCASVLLAETDGTGYSGTLYGANCNGTFAGTLTIGELDAD